MLDRLISLAVSVILGVLVWLYARSRDQEMLDNVPVPVTLSLPAHQADYYDLEVTGPSQVMASFSGPPSRIRELRILLQRGELRVEKELTIPEDRQNESRYLDTVRIDAGELHPPPGIRVILTEERNRIPVTLRRVIERPLPVRLDYQPDDPIAALVLEPATVLVRGPQEILEHVRAMPTRPYVPSRFGAASAKDNVISGVVSLVDELEGRPIRTTPSTVSVRLTLRARERIYDLMDVPVQFLCPANFPYRVSWLDERGGKTSLKVRGPAGDEPPTVSAFVDLTHRKFGEGLYVQEPLRLQLPKEYQLDQPPPQSASFRLDAMPGERGGAAPILGGTRAP
jgi:hypothetical protein